MFCDFKPTVRALFFPEKILHSVPYKGRNQESLVNLLWQTFKFFKYKHI